MCKFVKLSVLLLLTGTMAATALAQSPAPASPLKHYKTDFVVKEVDANGHVINSRSYSTILATTNEGTPNQIRSGDKVPIRSSSGENGDIKYQYIDIGVNIDCRSVSEIDQKLAMSITAEVSSVPAGADSNSTFGPLIRQFKWNSNVLISPGTPTTIFSSDDVSSKTKIEFEVTATPIK